MNLIYGLIALWLIMRLIKKIPRKMTLDVLANEVATNGRDEFFKKWKNKTFTIIGPVTVHPGDYFDGVKGLYPVCLLVKLIGSIYGTRMRYREIMYSSEKQFCTLKTFLLGSRPSPDYIASLGFNKELMNKLNSSWSKLNSFEISSCSKLNGFEIICVFPSSSSDLDKITDFDTVKVKGTLSAMEYDWNILCTNNLLRSNSHSDSLILTNCRILAVYDENGNKKR